MPYSAWKQITSPMGYQQIAAATLTASTPLTVPIINGRKPTWAVIQAETQSARYRDDEVAPTAAIGMLITVGDPLIYTGDLNKIRLINAVAGTILNIAYYQ